MLPSKRYTGSRCLRSRCLWSLAYRVFAVKGFRGQIAKWVRAAWWVAQGQIPHKSSKAARVAQAQTPCQSSEAARVAQAQTPCKSSTAASVAQAQTTCKSSEAFWPQIWAWGFCSLQAMFFLIRNGNFGFKAGPRAFEAFWQLQFGCEMVILAPNLDLELLEPSDNYSNYNLAVKWQFLLQLDRPRYLQRGNWVAQAQTLCFFSRGQRLCKRKPKDVRTGWQIARNTNVICGWPQASPTAKAEARRSFVCWRSNGHGATCCAGGADMLCRPAGNVRAKSRRAKLCVLKCVALRKSLSWKLVWGEKKLPARQGFYLN